MSEIPQYSEEDIQINTRSADINEVTHDIIADSDLRTEKSPEEIETTEIEKRKIKFRTDILLSQIDTYRYLLRNDSDNEAGSALDQISATLTSGELDGAYLSELEELSHSELASHYFKKMAEYTNLVDSLIGDYPDVFHSIDRSIEELEAETAGRQLAFRNEYINLLKLNFGMNPASYIASILGDSSKANVEKLRSINPRELDSKSKSELWDIYFSDSYMDRELQLEISAIILSPKISTGEFIGSIQEIQKAAISDDIKSICFAKSGINTSNETKLALLDAIQKDNFKPLEGCTLFEVGGYSAARKLKTLGAESVREADAGEAGGITGGGGHISKEKLLHLGTYRQYGSPHSMDLIISAQVFDYGSGIGAIAKSRNWRDKDDLGMQEMILTMTNLLRPGVT